MQLAPVERALETALDGAFRIKYSTYGLGTTGGVFGPNGGAITLRLVPIGD